MRVVVAPRRSFPSGEWRIVEVGGRSIGVFRVGESFYGIRNRCPHQGGPLCLGHPISSALQSTGRSTKRRPRTGGRSHSTPAGM
jgi:nitrite reductase/ring-hydroxylating ferredoxin subunit